MNKVGDGSVRIREVVAEAREAIRASLLVEGLLAIITTAAGGIVLLSALDNMFSFPTSLRVVGLAFGPLDGLANDGDGLVVRQRRDDELLRELAGLDRDHALVSGQVQLDQQPVGRADHAQRRFDECLAALRASWHQDPDMLLESLSSDMSRNVSALESLVRWLIDVDEQLSGERYREAALIEEIRTALVPSEPRYWNNLGLFLRDHGDQLKRGLEKPDKEQLDVLWRDAYAAYRQTLELAPDHPAYLNDTAVMLHYYLKREWDEAQRMYELAIANADAELAREELSSVLRSWYETARGDAETNLKRLERMRTDRRGKSDRQLGPGQAGAGN